MGIRRSRPALVATAAVALVAGTLVPVAAPADAAAYHRTPVLEKRIIGYSVQHRPIVAYHLGDRTLKTTSLIIGQMHGNEKAGVTVANAIINATVSIEGINLWVIPTMNPDGYAHNTRQNAHKVDLNRNWPDKWRRLTGQYYSGTRALSEPETRAVHAFLVAQHPKYVVVMHQPLYGVDTTDGGAVSKSFATALSKNLHLPKKAFRCWSTCYGSMTGWYTTHKVGVGETIEFGAHPSTSYLVNTARPGIIRALGGHFGTLAAHDPRYRVTVTAGTGTVTFSGWAYDIDSRTSRLTYRVTEGATLLATRTASGSAAGGHGVSLTLPATAGRHTYCTTITNIGTGTKNPRTCSTVTVAASS